MAKLSAVDAFSIAVEVSSLLQLVFPTFLVVPAFVGIPAIVGFPAVAGTPVVAVAPEC
jgi:hypothetical protein